MPVLIFHIYCTDNWDLCVFCKCVFYFYNTQDHESVLLLVQNRLSYQILYLYIPQWHLLVFHVVRMIHHMCKTYNGNIDSCKYNEVHSLVNESSLCFTCFVKHFSHLYLLKQRVFFIVQTNDVHTDFFGSANTYILANNIWIVNTAN